jgi:hypothetical protein
MEIGKTYGKEYWNKNLYSNLLHKILFEMHFAHRNSKVLGISCSKFVGIGVKWLLKCSDLNENR